MDKSLEEKVQLFNFLSAEKVRRLINMDKSLEEFSPKGAPNEEPEVIHPSQYNQMEGLETIEYIRAVLSPEEFRGFLKGNIMKYRDRAPYKGNPTSDYSKAVVYYDWLEPTRAATKLAESVDIPTECINEFMEKFKLDFEDFMEGEK